MGFAQAIRSCFQQYTTFSGRASRSEYWYFALFCFLAIGISVAIHPYLAGLINLVVLLPGISVVVRRLHDIDKSGWYYWVALIPVVGLILLLVWFCRKGTEGPNRFGTDPLAQLPQTSLPVTGIASLSVTEKAEHLAKLKSLLEAGTISQDEFNRMKAELLG